MDKTISMLKLIIYLLILFIFHPVYSETTTILLQSMSYDNDQYLTLSEATIASKNRMLKGIREEEYTFPKIFRYKVKQGEDIWTIIARTSLNIDTIATLNRLDFIGMVKEGGDVLLPDTLGVFLDRDRYEKAEIAQKYSIEEDNILTAEDPLNPEKELIFIPEVELSFLERTYLSGVVFHAPLMGARTSGYGLRVDPFINEMTFHGGIDISAKEGRIVRASRGGRVFYTGEESGYGNLIMLQHELGYYTIYGHLMEALVENGQDVETGQSIGKVGTTGRTTGPHLHFEIRRFGKQLNPENIPLFLNHN